MIFVVKPASCVCSVMGGGGVNVLLVTLLELLAHSILRLGFLRAHELVRWAIVVNLALVLERSHR